MNLVSIPTLRELLEDPGRVSDLPTEAVLVLLGEMEKLRAALWCKVAPMRHEPVDSKELAKRWNIPESWVRDNIRERTADPIPHVKFGCYVRFEWESPQLHAWFNRRRSANKKSLDKRNGLGVTTTRMERKA